MSSRFVDSNIFIYVMMDDPSYSDKALRILTGFEDGDISGWTSTLVLSQAFSHLKKRKKYHAIDKFYDYLDSTPISVAETTRDDLISARKASKEHGLPWSMWDDFILASQMRRLGLSEIYSNDQDFDKMHGIKRLF
jgi:predicted nucleic acid-binding protein